MESVQVRTVTDNLFGQVTSGSLLITGPLGVLNITKEKTPNPKIRRDVLEACDHHADTPWETKETQAPFGNISLSKCEFAVWQYKTYLLLGHWQSDRDVFFIPVRMMYYDYYKHDYEAPMLQGLLLLPSTDARGTYQRVGQLTAFDAFKGGKRPFPRHDKDSG